MTIDENMDTEEEGNDHESPKSEESDMDDSEHSTLSETEESSEIDEDTIEMRKCDCVADGHELEKAFQMVKNLLYEEKMKQIEAKLVELQAGTAVEYLEPLKNLDEKLDRRAQVAAIRKDYKLQMIDVLHESEALAAHQNFENDKLQLFDMVRNELEEKIRRLEEDRHNIDIHSDLWESQLFSKRHKVKKGLSTMKERKKKPVIVTGPYIIYMLDDMDVLEDWTAIKKALKQKQQIQKKFKASSSSRLAERGGVSSARERYLAKYHDGRLFYSGSYYNKGNHIIIDNKEDSPVHATITAISPAEIWVKKSDGNKSKLYIAQLQRGKYTIRNASY